MFDGLYYDQVDGVAMGSPLGPVLANIFMCHFEENWVINSIDCPNVWFRYVRTLLPYLTTKTQLSSFFIT